MRCGSVGFLADVWILSAGEQAAPWIGSHLVREPGPFERRGLLSGRAKLRKALLKGRARSPIKIERGGKHSADVAGRPDARALHGAIGAANDRIGGHALGDAHGYQGSVPGVASQAYDDLDRGCRSF